MEILNIKEKNLSIVTTFKSGHTLLNIAFIHLFNHLNIKVEIENNPNKILSNVYIFVRDPNDRFFSSYFWLFHMLKYGEDDYKNGIKNLIETTNVSDISSYINQHPIFIKECDDFHYLPQSSQILYNNKIIYKEEIVNSRTDLKLLYEAKFGLKYKIFKIEDIDKIINQNTQTLINRKVGFVDKLKVAESEIDKFSFLEDYPNETNFIFSTIYQYFKNIYKSTNHHRSVICPDEITLYDYNMVCSLTNNERIFFGYNKKDTLEKIFKKTLI
jgi:hypothetical protein